MLEAFCVWLGNVYCGAWFERFLCKFNKLNYLWNIVKDNIMEAGHEVAGLANAGRAEKQIE